MVLLLKLVSYNFKGLELFLKHLKGLVKFFLRHAQLKMPTLFLRFQKIPSPLNTIPAIS